MENSLSRSFSFVAVSGINFPYRSRRYLINLVQDIAKEDKVNNFIFAGNTLDGRSLEKDLKNRIKEKKESIKKYNETAPRGKKIKLDDKEKEEIRSDFIMDMALSFNDFLTQVGINYHIVMDEVYDRPIGMEVLRKLQDMNRDDIRLINDSEAKIPINIQGVEEMRVIVPRKKPWFYKVITGLMQRLIDSFVQRTFSPPPSLILVGCCGIGAQLPSYKGVYSFAIPTLHKINEQQSTESTVGCLSMKISKNHEGKLSVDHKRYYDFRSVIFNEREIATVNNVSNKEKRVIDALKSSSASLKTLMFRVNSNEQDFINEDDIKKMLGELEDKSIIVWDKESNRYSINESLVQKANVSLDEFLKDSKVIEHTVLSCFHVGALKSLYFTALKYLPINAVNSDALILNGDTILGLAHNTEYTGECLPIAVGYDKQEIIAAHIIHKILREIFEKRFERIRDKNNLAIPVILDKCLINLVINTGNHDLWENYAKSALPLSLLHSQLKSLLMKSIIDICEKNGLKLNLFMVDGIIEEKIIGVGENNVVEINGVPIGLKHPHKARTLAKSHRIQEVAAFFSEQKFKNYPELSLVYVANFHEAAAVSVSIFGRTILGVMTGAYLKDTIFENHKDKVVDYGSAKVRVCFNPKKQIIYSEVDFDQRIHSFDKKIVLADKLTSKDVLKLCLRLCKIVNLPWRSN